MLKPRTALITGASAGIGRELARTFAREHYDLVLVARSGDKLEELTKELHQEFLVKAVPMVCDLSRADDVEKLLKRIDDEKILVDVLVNNAGFGEFGAFDETSWGREQQMIDLNVSALVRLTKYFVPQMKKRGSGKILQVASTAAFQPGPFMAVYFATKSFVLSFSEAIAEELKGSGVTVTAVCPGPTKTLFDSSPGMSGAKLFGDRNIPTGTEVAEFAYRALVKGKKVAIHGVRNRILSSFVPITPRPLVLWIARRLIRGE